MYDSKINKWCLPVKYNMAAATGALIYVRRGVLVCEVRKWNVDKKVGVSARERLSSTGLLQIQAKTWFA